MEVMKVWLDTSWRTNLPPFGWSGEGALRRSGHANRAGEDERTLGRQRRR
jgi:hypothetical protein